MLSSQQCIRYLILTSLTSLSISFTCPPTVIRKITILADKNLKKTTTTIPRACSDDDFTLIEESTTSRSTFIKKSVLATTLSLFLSPTTEIVTGNPSSSVANAATAPPSTTESNKKQLNLSPSEIAAIVESDLVERSFLTNGQLTRSIYSESATFKDEIDTYKLDAWMKGTAKLFVPPPSSKLNLVGKIEASASEISFRFDEDLMFRIPFRPVVHLTGKVVLKREADTGLISSYQEIWDQDVKTVLKSAKFSGLS